MSDAGWAVRETFGASGCTRTQGPYGWLRAHLVARELRRFKSGRGNKGVEIVSAEGLWE